ncbi:MAG: Tex family protein [Psittacicella sp.]
MTSYEKIIDTIALELKVDSDQIQAAYDLYKEGNTIPFIARYRKEATKNLDDAQLRYFEERLNYLNDFYERQNFILKTIKDLGKLTSIIESKLNQAQTKVELEDIYLPFKPRRKTKGSKAVENGLEPLAERLWLSKEEEIDVSNYLNKEVTSDEEIFEGSLYILIEKFALDSDLLKVLRDKFLKEAILESKETQDSLKDISKFKDYFEYKESLKLIPPHRFMAILRGRSLNELSVKILPYEGSFTFVNDPYIQEIVKHLGKNIENLTSFQKKVIQKLWRVKLLTKLETESLLYFKENSEIDAINIFGKNLESILMTSPIPKKMILGLDPGIRTGVKFAIIDEVSRVLNTGVLYLHQKMLENTKEILLGLIKEFKVDFISIGNGTGSRETEDFVKDVLKENALNDIYSIVVNEAGASVYSASELASLEFPDMDVSLRGAVSIARRLQDPMAEFVKIDPKSIGVGQYQHDVNQKKLSQKLTNVVEDCVNKVGVDLNTASKEVLKYIAGIDDSLARNIVLYRDEFGSFKSRNELEKVPRLGEKTFKQCAGFLRILDSNHPLDRTSIHPEIYEIISNILNSIDCSFEEALDSNSKFKEAIKSVNLESYITDEFGLSYIKEALSEIQKPLRDPRGEFVSVKFEEGINTISDLKLGMKLKGIVTNIANFGVFVNIGVHQDAFIHISKLSKGFVKNPRDILDINDIIDVNVIDIDLLRNRISLSLINEIKSNKNNLKTKVQGKLIFKDKNKEVAYKDGNNKSSSNQNFGNSLGSLFKDTFSKLK